MEIDRFRRRAPCHPLFHPIALLGNTLALAGAGLLWSNPWLPLAAVLAARAVTDLAIVPEERHMAARFGEGWAAYARRVPRWLGARSLAAR